MQSKQERRRYTRHELPCPIKLLTDKGELLTKSRVTNVSDGGILVPLPREMGQELSQQMVIDLSVPRATLNSYMIEQFSSHARLIRADQPNQSPMITAAFEFDKPLKLMLD